MAIVNSTSSFRLADRLDICVLLIENYKHAKKNKGFDAISLRVYPVGQKPLTALIYSSGAVVMLGAKSVPQMHAAKEKICRITRSSISVELKIHNLVASVTLAHHMDLSKMFYKLQHDVRFSEVCYEPELSPAVTATETHTSRKACFFISGKINLVGCKSFDELENFEKLIKSLT